MGAKTLGVASFHLRAVCQNRKLWGVEDFMETTIRHSKCAASRFAHEAAPALTRFARQLLHPSLDSQEYFFTYPRNQGMKFEDAAILLK